MHVDLDNECLLPDFNYDDLLERVTALQLCCAGVSAEVDKRVDANAKHDSLQVESVVL